MDQHTYSFPKVSPADPQELRDALRSVRRAASDEAARERREDDARRDARRSDRH